MTHKVNNIPSRQKCVNKKHPYIGGAVDIVDDNTGESFDTSLGKPIWWNGTAWVDATGTPV